jgi:hypothetical protein
MQSSATLHRHSHWGLVTLNGVLLLLAGLFLAIFPFAGALSFTAAVGIYLVAVGAMGLFVALKALADGHGSVLAFVGPPLAMLLGVIFWMAPAAGLAGVMELAGAFAMVGGIFQVAAAFGMAGRMHWGLLLFNGLLTLGAGPLALLASSLICCSTSSTVNAPAIRITTSSRLARSAVYFSPSRRSAVRKTAHNGCTTSGRSLVRIGLAVCIWLMVVSCRINDHGSG